MAYDSLPLTHVSIVTQISNLLMSIDSKYINNVIQILHELDGEDAVIVVEKLLEISFGKKDLHREESEKFLIAKDLNELQLKVIDSLAINDNLWENVESISFLLASSGFPWLPPGSYFFIFIFILF